MMTDELEDTNDKDLVVGTRYRATFDDCCVAGIVNLGAYLGSEDHWDLEFENGTITVTLGVRFTPEPR